MHLCFDCNGPLKLIAKPGRTVFMEDTFWSVFPDCKLSTCTECGTICEIEYDSMILLKQIEAQKALKPSPRLLALRKFDSKLADLLDHPEGDVKQLTSKVVSLLGLRDAHLRKLDKPDNTASNAFKRFLKRLYPGQNARQLWESQTNMDDVAEDLNIFCDLLINVGI